MIIFKTLRIKNFLTYGNYFTEVDLNSYKRTLIVGKNASGKSSIPLAVCYALFGKTYRKLNLPQLVNSINEKNCLVELVFSIQEDEYLVRRGQKPSVFEIYKNDVLIPQTTKDYQSNFETNILKTDFKTFSSIVTIGGRNYVSFMNLTKLDRRKIIESILDIDIFSTMNVVTKTMIVENNTRIKELRYEQIRLENEIKTLDDIIEESNKGVNVTTEAHLAKINLLYEKEKALSKSLDEVLSNIRLIQEETGNIDSLYNTFQERIRTVSEKIKREPKTLSDLDNQIAFYSDHDVCPVCSQSIQEETKTKQLNGLISARKKQVKYFEKQHNSLKELKTIFIELSNKKKEVTKLVEHKKSLINDITRIKEIILELEHSFDSIIIGSTDVSKYKTLKLTDETILQTVLEEISAKNENVAYLEYCQSLLKDEGIKTLIIKEYLPLINTILNSYLEQMGLYINFVFDEFFNEIIKSRHRDIFSYESFSDGQKLKIDLALLFTWREISKIKNSLNVNILFCDEIVDSSLDRESTEVVIDLLNSITENINYFVISHKAELFETRVSRTLKLSIQDNFTTIKEIV